jgi:amidophosphoribosyltransferase
MFREKCGVVAVRSYGGAPVAPIIVNCLRALQHRGQEGWGVSLWGWRIFRRAGLVSDSAQHFLRLIGNRPFDRGIGHVRYSTVGGPQYLQPLEVRNLRVAHNGTVVNYSSLLREAGLPEDVRSDSMALAARLAVALEDEHRDWASAFAELSKSVVGSFCLVVQDGRGTLAAARDPLGFRPLCVGYIKENDTYIVASESCALEAVGARLLCDVKPGQLVVLDEGGPSFQTYAESRAERPCAFEYVYFAHPSSVIDGVSVYEVRRRVGRLMAERCPLEGDVVIPVPDSARPAALGYAERLGIPFEEGLLKDRYSRKGGWRSFIEPDEESRREINRLIVPIKSTVQGKRVILVDDSLVRGISASEIIRILKKAGAVEVNLVLTFPPILHPCFMGIDFPEKEELAVYRASLIFKSGNICEKVAKLIGADRVVYNDPRTLAEAIGKDVSRLCFSCVTGDYYPLPPPPASLKRALLKGG